jgi:hypothetical protein
LHTEFSNQTIDGDSIPAVDKRAYAYISQYCCRITHYRSLAIQMPICRMERSKRRQKLLLGQEWIRGVSMRI